MLKHYPIQCYECNQELREDQPSVYMLTVEGIKARHIDCEAAYVTLEEL